MAAVTESVGHLSPWLPWAANYSRAAAAAFLDSSDQSWADGNVYNYAITTAGALAGGIGLMARIGPGGLEIGYWVHQAFTRRGLATAAAAALVEQAFRLPDVDRLEIVHDELNVASGGYRATSASPKSAGASWTCRRRPAPASASSGGSCGSVHRHGIRASRSDRSRDDGAGPRPGAGQPGRRRRAGRGGARRGQCQPRAAARRSRAQRAGAARRPGGARRDRLPAQRSRRPSYHDTTLYTTLSPCQMCSGAILLFQIPRVVVGEAETFERPRPSGCEAWRNRAARGRGLPAAMREFRSVTRRSGARTSAAADERS